MVKYFLLGVSITNATQEEILEYILQGLQKTDEKYYIVTPNSEFLVYAVHHPEFKRILNNARLGLPDGTGVILAGKILGKNFKERVTGTDLMENLCKAISKQPITVGFLGGGPKIAERTAECLVSKYPGLKVVFAGSKWPSAEVAHENFLVRQRDKVQIIKPDRSLANAHSENFVSSPRSSNLTMEQFNNGAIDILFVAFGFPRQEEWMSKHIGKVPVRVMMGVGGAFDYISGEVPRAPKFVRSLGLEWLFRLFIQPWRLKRQLALLEFPWLVLKERVSLKMSS